MSSPYDRTSVNRRCAFPLRVTLEAAGPLQSVLAIDVNVGRKRMLAFLRFACIMTKLYLTFWVIFCECRVFEHNGIAGR